MNAPNRTRMPAFDARRRRLMATAAALPLIKLPFAASLADDAPAQERGIRGQFAPELDVEFWLDAEGEPTTFQLADHAGKWVHIKCWQHWCPGCHKHGFPALQKFVEAFPDDSQLVNVGIQTTFEGHWFNDESKVRKTQLRYDLPIVMGHDPGKRNDHGYPNTMVSYRTGGTPWHIIISPDGRVVFNGFNIDADRAIAFIREHIDKAQTG